MKIEQVQKIVSQAIFGKEEVVRLALSAFLSRGHLLIEDVPGIGKTRLACALAQAMSLNFHRIQCTSDLLPSDIIGALVFSQEQEFVFKKGPIFAHLVLADELNRTPPKTQSALLEAMNERQISVDGKAYFLPNPFFVVATQNPTEFYGTYPLPESQLDRFAMRLKLGYPTKEAEQEIVTEKSWIGETPTFPPCIEKKEVLALQKKVLEIQIHEKLLAYLLELVQRTRNHPLLGLGASPRGAKAFLLCSKAHALLSGRDYVIPDDIKTLFLPCLAHRVTLRESNLAAPPLSVWEKKEKVLMEISREVPVPR